MKFTQAKIGRVFILKFDHSDDFLSELKEFAANETISNATITFLGALEKGEIVTGSVDLSLPADPVWNSFDKPMEVLGFGIITKRGNAEHSHIHVSLGRDKKALCGCLRKGTKVFLTIEAVLHELVDTNIGRDMDESTGHDLLKFD